MNSLRLLEHCGYAGDQTYFDVNFVEWTVAVCYHTTETVDLLFNGISIGLLYSLSWNIFCFLGRILDYIFEPASISLPLSSPSKTKLTHIACGRAHLVVATDKEGGKEQQLMWKQQIGPEWLFGIIFDSAVRSNFSAHSIMQTCACFLRFKLLLLLEESEKEFQTENFPNFSSIVLLVISVLSLEPLKIAMCTINCTDDIQHLTSFPFPVETCISWKHLSLPFF